MGVTFATSDTLQASGPKYAQLKDHLIQMIRTGRITPGQMLPSENQIAKDMQIARNTVRQALNELEQENVVEKVHGKGTFVSEQAIARLRKGLNVFALLVDEMDGFYFSLQVGFDAAATRVHHQAIVTSSDNNVYRQSDAIIQLVDKRVSGIVLVPVTDEPTPPHQIRLIQSNNIPLVFCHRRPDHIRAPLLAIPFERVGLLAGQTLIKRGHKQIAFIGRHDKRVSKVYLNGLNNALEQAGMPRRDDLVFYGESTSAPNSDEFLKRTLNDVLRRPDDKRPTAIFSTFDLEAERIYLALMSMGVSVPGDVSLISFGGAARQSAVQEQLTSVVVNEAWVGERAVALLNEINDGRKSPQSSEICDIPIELYTGHTVRSLT